MKKIEPKIPENEPNNPFLKLKQILGFTQVWCINADSGFDLWANSLLTVCEYPEYFYMADCKNAYVVSKTEWESYLNNYMDTNASMPKIFYADSIPQNERYGFEFFVSKEELLSNLIYNTPLVELGQIMINNEGSIGMHCLIKSIRPKARKSNCSCCIISTSTQEMLFTNIICMY